MKIQNCLYWPYPKSPNIQILCFFTTKFHMLLSVKFIMSSHPPLSVGFLPIWHLGPWLLNWSSVAMVEETLITLKLFYLTATNNKTPLIRNRNRLIKNQLKSNSAFISCLQWRQLARKKRLIKDAVVFKSLHGVLSLHRKMFYCQTNKKPCHKSELSNKE